MGANLARKHAMRGTYDFRRDRDNINPLRGRSNAKWRGILLHYILHITKRRLVEVKFPKNSYIGTAVIDDLKTTDIVVAQRRRFVNSSGVSAIIAAYCEKDGILSLTTDMPSTSGELIMSAYVLYGSTCN